MTFSVRILLLLFISFGKLKASITVNRTTQDTFTNPLCEEGVNCKTEQCARHYAKCETKSCEVCICDNYSANYLASEKRCLNDDKIVSQTVPEYSSFAISRSNVKNVFLAVQPSGIIQRKSIYNGDLQETWIYTTSSQLLNLKSLECLDYSNGIARSISVKPCKAGKEAIGQKWYCPSSGNDFYGKMNGSALSLDFTSIHFLMFKTRPRLKTKWIAKPKTDGDFRSICELPLKYEGCYRYTDGSSVKRIDPGIPKGCIKSSKRPECYTTLSISAPLFGYGASQSTTCSVDWSRSLFTANNEPWISFKSPIFNPRFDTRHFKNISLKIHQEVANLWAGTLMKLTINCNVHNFDNTEETVESHCILIKFNGRFDLRKCRMKKMAQ
ncbi:uncharacterized protein LOC124434103 isoform X2 [Xenia sp. Carnegie-2017]|uniref:uncharacterized protein LOC124434103 isoform X2 n=1 Tax=Xenia sp. Carnegie-2017 TaxID=2897299 RepID=UPI001F036D2D|nr:uncharacterized protein LOC124434103 isoform X2 [Xenia sp. Carnegie-2017]